MANQHQSARKAVTAAKADIAAAITAAMAITKAALENRTVEEVRVAMEMPQNEAPMWTHIAKGLAQSVVKAEQAAGPTVQNNLNLVLVPTAESNAQWLQSVEPLKQLEGGRRKALEAEVSKASTEPRGSTSTKT